LKLAALVELMAVDVTLSAHPIQLQAMTIPVLGRLSTLATRGLAMRGCMSDHQQGFAHRTLVLMHLSQCLGQFIAIAQVWLMGKGACCAVTKATSFLKERRTSIAKQADGMFLGLAFLKGQTPPQ
jgi:hypothetical protein